MARKIEGLKTYLCENYSCWMTRDGCSRLKKKAHMPKTRIMFVFYNELALCRTCGGIK